MSHPPEPPPLFGATPSSITECARQLIQRLRQTQRQIIDTVLPEDATFSNVLLPLAQAENAVSADRWLITSYRNFSPDAALQDAANVAATMFEDFELETSLNNDLFNLINTVLRIGEQLDCESRRYLEKKYKGHIRNGLLLSEDSSRQHFQTMQSRIAVLEAEYKKNLADSRLEVWLNRQDLRGVPDEVLSRFKSDTIGDEQRFRCDSRTILQVMMFATNADTRRLCYMASENTCRGNEPVFKELILLRAESARLLGYTSHAALRLEDRMAKTPDVVNNFLTDLVSMLSETANAEVENLKAMKKNDVESRGESFDGNYYFWDHAFYNRLMMEREYELDQQQLAEYFPLLSTIESMLEINQHLFGLVFTEITKPNQDSGVTLGYYKSAEMLWHDDVRVFGVWNDKQEGGDFVGYLYLDLYDRKGKPPNACNVPIRPGCILPDGSRQSPATALLFDFEKPSVTNPTLLQHRDVILLFHELGHGIHELVAQTKFACFHGTASPVDFAEMPSQVLENWCWTPSQLKRLGRHYSYLSADHLQTWSEAANGKPRPTERLSDSEIANLTRSKHCNSALLYLRQTTIGMFDMLVHQITNNTEAEKWELAVKWNQLRREVLPLAGGEAVNGDWAWGHGYANFRHLIEDYDAGYYSYLFSLVYAADVFNATFKLDPENTANGRRYRHAVLTKGASEDEMTILTRFLGRELDFYPFSQELNLS
ncbi:metallopeptidase MepB [Trichoderma camerunense]